MENRPFQRNEDSGGQFHTNHCILVPLFTGMQERFIRYWKVVIATLETYKICVPDNLINKHTVQRGAKQFQTREPQIKQTLAAQDIRISACQKLNPFSTPKKPE